MLKRTFDFLVALVIAILTGPFLLIIALLIKVDSRGPVFFVQNRIGKDGRVFRMCKFRTMVVNAERIGTGLFSYADDPRVTRVGRILRSTSLDELPQIFNVIGGSMSIVGPRPPVVNELDGYGLEERIKLRMSVKPGITGLAQLSGRNALDWPEKLVFDDEYVERFRRIGIFEDIRLLLLTPWVVLSRKNVIEPRRNQVKERHVAREEE